MYNLIKLGNYKRFSLRIKRGETIFSYVPIGSWLLGWGRQLAPANEPHLCQVSVHTLRWHQKWFCKTCTPVRLGNLDQYKSARLSLDSWILAVWYCSLGEILTKKQKCPSCNNNKMITVWALASLENPIKTLMTHLSVFLILIMLMLWKYKLCLTCFLTIIKVFHSYRLVHLCDNWLWKYFRKTIKRTYSIYYIIQQFIRCTVHLFIA